MSLRILKFSLVFAIALVPLISSANPFRKYYVCVPKVRPTAADLRFHIREADSCKQDEYWANVIPKKDGTILLIPADAPLTPDNQKDLKKFREYHGIER